jgi:DNA-binding winged helix-turn-helix (wHTH) protein/Tol biopolymer transport system component
MSLKNNSFRFGDFVLDRDERVLTKGGKPVPLPPKAFKLLSVLVQNPGRIVEKDDLMRQVWEDTFVEEANITYTIRLLRKTLEEDRRNPRFVETVPRRGYRFIADVQLTEFKENDEPEISESVIEINNKNVSKVPSRRYWLLFPMVAVLLVLTGASWFMWPRPSGATPVFPTVFSIRKLTTDGRVTHAVISPDGRSVINVVENEEDSGIWLHQIETGNNINLVPTSNDRYGGIAISPDGNFLYFARSPRIDGKQFDIYRTTVFGGVPAKIVSDAQGWMSISPDGYKVSFVRCPYTDNEYCSLWIADSTTGDNQQRLVTRPQPLRISANQFSSDGRAVIFASGQSENAANDFNLFKTDIESGTETSAAKEPFFNIKSISLRAGKDDLLITAKRFPETNFRIWDVAKDGSATPLTEDSETFSMVNSDRTGDVMAAVRSESDISLTLHSLSPPFQKRTLIDAVAAGFPANFPGNGQILFSSTVNGSGDIWCIQQDGIGKRQLTNDPGDETAPVLSRNGQIIYFASNRNGQVQIWRMNADGSDQKQLTQKDGGFPLWESPDGKWLYYQHGLTRDLWRIATGTLSQENAYSEPSYKYAISPDGTKAALSEKSKDGQTIIKVISLQSKKQLATLSPVQRQDPVWEIEWDLNGSAILYSLHDVKDRSSTVWEQPFNSRPPKRLLSINDSFIYYLSMSRDLRSLAVVDGRWRHDAVVLNAVK